MEHITFPRSVKPSSSVGKPELIGFADGSLEAYCCTIYLRWLCKEHGKADWWEARILCGKARITSGTTTAPRSEMQGLMILLRLVLIVLKSIVEIPVTVILATDSECTISALEKTRGSLKPFLANRVSEAEELMEQIRGITELVDLQHIPGSVNIADLATRATACSVDVGEGSLWQTGPKFLSLPRADWPLSRKFRDLVPVEELRVIRVNCTRVIPPEGNMARILGQVLESSNNLGKVLGVTARLLKAWCQKNRGSISKGPVRAQDREAAFKVLLALEMDPSLDALRKRKLESLGARERKGIVTMKGRAGSVLCELLNTPDWPVLMPGTRLARLIMIEAHEQTHRQDVRDVMARARSRAWIVRARGLAKAVVKSCPECRLKSKKLASQIMSEVPTFQMTPSSPFTYTSLDFCGPYLVRGVINMREKVLDRPPHLRHKPLHELQLGVQRVVGHRNHSC